ncbi:hypothetical protein B0H11DRAFT_1904416 [Mycena galericulata]|nr:hypothetical protein B0H11DRAFT_1904416 [Mycena galericulata]
MLMLEVAELKPKWWEAQGKSSGKGRSQGGGTGVNEGVKKRSERMGRLKTSSIYFFQPTNAREFIHGVELGAESGVTATIGVGVFGSQEPIKSLDPEVTAKIGVGVFGFTGAHQGPGSGTYRYDRGLQLNFVHEGGAGRQSSSAVISHPDVLELAVDPEALTDGHDSQTTNTRDNFRDLLVTRDRYRVFTAMAAECCQGTYIVPFSKGDAWLKQIIDSRIPEDGEVVSDLTSINEIRNGMLVANTLHPLVDQKKLVVLKTPNRILTCGDVPTSSNANQTLPDSVEYSTNPRYTLQWLNGDPYLQSIFTNNKDAAFKKNAGKSTLPSPLLLHYNYGVAALKWWGKGPEYLITARTRPSPQMVSPPKSNHDCAATTKTLEEARILGGADAGGSTEIEDIDERREADAERLVLKFYTNTPAARRRRAQETAEKQDRMTQWRSDVLGAR